MPAETETKTQTSQQIFHEWQNWISVSVVATDGVSVPNLVSGYYLHAERVLSDAILGFDDTLIFSGLSVTTRMLYAAMKLAEDSLQPALVLLCSSHTKW